MPVHPAASTERTRCLHESPQRLVWQHAPAESGAAEVHKVYLAGSPSDAEREAQMGAACAGDGADARAAATTEARLSRRIRVRPHARRTGKNIECWE